VVRPAKHRLTLVSSFSGHDVDPDRVTKAGARLLADYLDYASSGGSAPQASGGARLDPFESDVRSRLAAAGITVVPQYGVGGYRVDFAVTHPDDPERMVLAIEADGASYRESGSVRDRDRLRGEHLQRLGWRYHRLWSTNWFQNPEAEVAKVQAAYQRAISGTGPRAEQHRGEPAATPGSGSSSGRSRPAPAPAAQAPPALAPAALPPPALAQPAESLPPAEPERQALGARPAQPERQALDAPLARPARQPVRLTLPTRR